MIRDLDLVLHRGERVIVRGPNGSGKTTLLRCIAGVLAPTGGRITIAGNDAGSLSARGSVGASLAGERSFYLRLTARQNLLFFATLRVRSRRLAELAVAGLEEELRLEGILGRRMAECSTGMVQQVAIARALLGDPALVVLDEPTRSLDTDAVERCWSALERRTDVAVVVASHRDEDAAHGVRTLELEA